MEQYGFVECRLAPNLLHSTIENAIQKAELMSSILNMNKKNKFKITENYFKNMIKLVNLENYRFYFTCVGLSCYPTIGLNLNISKMTLSILCSYVNSTAIPINEIKYDIYNIELWKVAKKFIYERISAMKNFCNECSIIGICRGSCILMGLDIENQKNEAACSYQKKIWKEFIKSMIENENLHKMD